MGKPVQRYPATLAELQRLTHYQALGLTEAASSAEIERSLDPERWPWHLVEEEARQFATQRRVEAFGVLIDPRTRLAYDIDQGFTRKHLAGEIGNDHSVWAQAWIAAFVVSALMLVLGGGAAVARTLGTTFAPDFEEVAVYKEDCIDRQFPCDGHYVREFRSSSGAWDWVLNRQIELWIGPAPLLVGLAMLTRTTAARASGWVVAWARYRIWHDAVFRAVPFVPMAAIPVGVLLYMWLAVPEGIPLPNSG